MASSASLGPQPMDAENPVLVRPASENSVFRRVLDMILAFLLFLVVYSPQQAAALAIDDAAFSRALCVLPVCFLLAVLATLGAELHFQATGTEDWATLLLFLAGLALVVFAVRRNTHTHTRNTHSVVCASMPLRGLHLGGFFI
jgi:hypothetical protein